MQKVMIFVDFANFAHAARSFNRRPDLITLRDYLANPEQGRALLEMVVYLGLPPDKKPEEMPEQWKNRRDFVHKLRTSLENNGIMTVTHLGKANRDAPDDYTANVDILMAMDALEFALEAHPDIVVLVTGDQDFSYLAKKLRRKGIRVEAANIERQIGPLKMAVNSFVNLDEHFNEQTNGQPIGTGTDFFDQED